MAHISGTYFRRFFPHVQAEKCSSFCIKTRKGTKKGQRKIEYCRVSKAEGRRMGGGGGKKGGKGMDGRQEQRKNYEKVRV
jgi:hypothetical protein